MQWQCDLLNEFEKTTTKELSDVKVCINSEETYGLPPQDDCRFLEVDRQSQVVVDALCKVDGPKRNQSVSDWLEGN